MQDILVQSGIKMPKRKAEAQAEEFQRFIVSDYDQGFPAGPT